MKQLLIVALLVICNSLEATEKHALIIAAGKYSPQTKWSNISSVNDVPLIREALITRGFNEDKISELTNEVTRAHIIESFNQLKTRISTGDVVVIHYSGHGYQIPDDDGDEEDGLDEALVPEDAQYDGGSIKETAFYANYIRDDEFGRMLDEVRTILGPSGNLLVTIDACHSGTATRGIGPARGAVRTEFPKKATQLKLNSRGPNSDFGFTPAGGSLAPMACIFASSEDQLNYEYHTPELQCGSLSFAFSAAIAETDANASYRTLFDHIRNTMASIVPRQIPHAEGEFDQEMLGGKLLPKASYMTINKWIDNKSVEINAGTLMSLHVGSKVGFYPADTRDIKGVKPLAIGEVIRSKTISSEVKITEGEITQAMTGRLWVYVTEKNFGSMAISVLVQNFNKTQTDQLKKGISEYPFITVVEQGPANILLEFDPKKSQIVITTLEDFVTYSKPLSSSPTGVIEQSQVTELIRNMTAYAQAKYLRGVESSNPRFNASIKLLPHRLKEGGNRANVEDYEPLNPDEFIEGPANKLVVPVGTFIRVEITNLGSSDFYFSLLDIMPDNDMYLMFPEEFRSAQEYKVPAFKSVVPLGIFEIGPPYGDDMLKLIVTERPLEIRGIISSRGSGATHGTNSPFEVWFQKSYKSESGTRGPTNQSFDIEVIGIYSHIYRIVEAVLP